LLSKIAARENRDAEGLEKFRPDPHALTGQIFVRCRHVAFGQDAVAPTVAAQQSKSVKTRGLNAGQSFQAREQFLVKCGALFGFDTAYKIDVELYNVLAVEAHV